MIRTIKIALKALLVIATIVVCFLFSFLFVVYQPCNYDKRPANVPKTAIWEGFCPGGVWIDLIEIRGDTARFRIYNGSGDLTMDADYISDTCLNFKLAENNWNHLWYFYSGAVLHIHEGYEDGGSGFCGLRTIIPVYYTTTPYIKSR